MHYHFKVLQKDFDIVKGPTDELRIAPSPLLLRLKRLAESPDSEQDPFAIINREINRIQAFLDTMKPKKEKIEELTFLNYEMKRAFQIYLSAWKNLKRSFQGNGHENSSHMINEDNIIKLKGPETLEINDFIIDFLSDKLPEDKVEIMKLLIGKKMKEEETIYELGMLGFEQDEITLVIEQIKGSIKNKIIEPKKIHILNIMKNTKFSKTEMTDKLRKLNFHEDEIEAILKSTKEIDINYELRDKAVKEGEEAEKLLVKIEKRQFQIRNEHALEA